MFTPLTPITNALLLSLRHRYEPNIISR